MNVLIIEDEEVAYENLCKMLKKYDPSIKVEGWFKSIQAVVSWFEKNRNPDLIFLDIKLADGLSFEIFKQVKIEVPVIFTTAYHEYALKAFELNSVDYLLKPFSAESLARSIEKLKRFHLKDNQLLVEKIKAVVDTMSLNPDQFKDRFLVKIGAKLQSIPAANIAYFYRDEVVMLVSKQDEKFPVNYSLDELEDILSPKLFFRLNRQFLVNIEAVHLVHSYFSGKLKAELTPKLEFDILISKEKASTFKNWLDGK